MDTELFELCKEVYERTRWKNVRDLYFNSSIGWTLSDFGKDVKDANEALEDEPGDWLPLYTSDYLLDRLCEHRGKAGVTVYHVHSTMQWEAFYAGKSFDYGTDGQHWDTQADTPLKALLKLTIALDDAGELK